MMKNPNFEEIIQLLEDPTEDRRPVVRRIERNAALAELITALNKSRNSLVREILCDILGRRHEKAAVSTLINVLQDKSPGVRASAADALAKIGDIRAGKPLLQHLLNKKEDVRVKQMLSAALGAVGYRPAIPFLIQLLSNPNEVLRGCAAWSLGNLKAEKAKEALELALAKETDVYAKERLQEALVEIAHPSEKKKQITRRRSLKTK